MSRNFQMWTGVGIVWLALFVMLLTDTSGWELMAVGLNFFGLAVMFTALLRKR